MAANVRALAWEGDRPVLEATVVEGAPSLCEGSHSWRGTPAAANEIRERGKLEDVVRQGVAQLAERLAWDQEVAGSSPASLTTTCSCLTTGGIRE